MTNKGIISALFAFFLAISHIFGQTSPTFSNGVNITAFKSPHLTWTNPKEDNTGTHKEELELTVLIDCEYPIDSVLIMHIVKGDTIPNNFAGVFSKRTQLEYKQKVSLQEGLNHLFVTLFHNDVVVLQTSRNVYFIESEAKMQVSYDKANEYYNSGLQEFNKRHFKAASILFQKAIEENPKNIEYRFKAGLAYKMIGNNNEALNAFASINVTQPFHLDARYQSALVKINLGAYTEAHEDLMLILDHDSTYPGAKETLLNITTSIEQRNNPCKKLNKYNGRDHALIIAVESYSNNLLDTLSGIIDSARALKQILTNQYSFSEEDVVFLQNPSSTLLRTYIHNLQQKLGIYDNLLIYFAGHGKLDHDSQMAYWCPNDVVLNEQGHYINNGFSNDDLKGALRGFKCKHILVIANACYSSTIISEYFNMGIGGKEINMIKSYEKYSREALTSTSTLETCVNNGKFIGALLHTLRMNTDPCISIEKIATNVIELYEHYAGNAGFDDIVKAVNDQIPPSMIDGGGFILFQKE